MSKIYDDLKNRSYSLFRTFAREYPPFNDANLLLGAAESAVSLTRSKINKTIDTEWIDKIEAAIPAIDLIVRNPSVAIEDVDEILPVELSKHITEKSIKHLAQHTNLILDIKDDEITPSKILNVFHEETALTYENKFVNTLISRLSAFVDKRLRALNGGSGIEMDYKFDYSTEFEHFTAEQGGRNSARIHLAIELTSPLGREMSESDLEINERYIEALERVKRIHMALMSFNSSAFAQKLGRNYVRPPVIRTNAILKNKNLRECLNLWEYIENYDKVGYSFVGDKYYELPSADFVGGMYSSAALQYLTLYTGTGAELEDNRLVTEKHLFETMPEFDDDVANEELEDYQVYDSEYKKTVPVSRLMNNRKKLSEDEKRIRRAILVALRADDILNADLIREEAEARRLAREKRLAEEEAARLAAEEAARIAAEEAARLLAEQEAARIAAEEEAARLAAEAAMREVEFRYRRSFLSRYIQAPSYIQDYYTDIKNELLSYKGVKSRISWGKESFNLGRTHVAKINVKGKMLYLYLSEIHAELEAKYHAITVEGDCPILIKVRTDRKKKYAIALIRMLMEQLGLEKIDRAPEDYRLPYEETDALVARGLVKMILRKGEVLDENAVAVKADFSNAFARRKPQTEDEEGEDSLDADASDISGDEEGEAPAEGFAMREVEFRYRRSFLSRYIQAPSYVQDYYTDIKNELLSYKGVKARMSWGKESFNLGRAHVAKINVKGKMLYLYLAEIHAELDAKYHAITVSGSCPILIKLRTDRKKKYAIELIRMLMEQLELKKTDRAPEDYRLPYEDTEALIARGLVKMILPKGEVMDENTIAVKADFRAAFARRNDQAAEENMADPEALEISEAAEEIPAPEAEAEAEAVADPEPMPEEKSEDAEALLPLLCESKNDARIEKIIDSIVCGEVTLKAKDAVLLLSKNARATGFENRGFVFSDGEPEGECDIVIPYTAEEYSDLSRWDRKRVLKNAEMLIRYHVTLKLCDLLEDACADSERAEAALDYLEGRAAKQKKALRLPKQWENAIQRVEK